jgi:uncharacterized protein with NRDE domain
MCTVTFIARRRGYCLGMNRDEKLTRASGLPPMERVIAGRRVICPSEPRGGTWIASNESGVTFALINWYSIAARVASKATSRGQVVVGVSALDNEQTAQARLEKMPLATTNPFRLIGIFPGEASIIEWRWDLKRLTHQKHAWQTKQWISSGFAEATAQKIRSQTFQAAWQQSSAGTLQWLRRLHRSHAPEPGPFSICMHREDAATVSYTEVVYANGKSRLSYEAREQASAKEPG